MYGLAHRIKKELYEIAAERGIENRSKMKCGELLKAIQSTLGKHPEGTKGQQPASVVKIYGINPGKTCTGWQVRNIAKPF